MFKPHRLNNADFPTFGLPTRIIVGRSFASTLVKSNLDFFRDFFFPLGLSAVKEGEEDPERGASVDNRAVCHVEGTRELKGLKVGEGFRGFKGSKVVDRGLEMLNEVKGTRRVLRARVRRARRKGLDINGGLIPNGSEELSSLCTSKFSDGAPAQGVRIL